MHSIIIYTELLGLDLRDCDLKKIVITNITATTLNNTKVITLATAAPMEAALLAVYKEMT